jgi:hypothetical protein
LYKSVSVVLQVEEVRCDASDGWERSARQRIVYACRSLKSAPNTRHLLKHRACNATPIGAGVALGGGSHVHCIGHCVIAMYSLLSYQVRCLLTLSSRWLRLPISLALCWLVLRCVGHINGSPVFDQLFDHVVVLDQRRKVDPLTGIGVAVLGPEHNGRDVARARVSRVGRRV